MRMTPMQRLRSVVANPRTIAIRRQAVVQRGTQHYPERLLLLKVVVPPRRYTRSLASSGHCVL
jgi:hypothetical protein